MGRVEGKHVVITGAAQGIGLGCARVFLEEGARVSALDLKTPPALGENAAHLACDVRRREVVDDALARARTRFGPIDVVLHVAGTAWHAELENNTDADYDAMMDVHVRSALHLLRGVVGEWKARRAGKFIGVTSPAAVRGQVNGTIYSAAKSALIGIVRSAALELAPWNVQVNAVLPMAATPMAEIVRSDPALDARYLARVPLGRWGEPEEIARTFLFLASRDADYVTGVVLPVDGGRII
ncbi:SDR family oxidoreductase [Myxococcota bacterium]|nr:SDR family oxidoreductase [Myxococcota bacterium]